jgi:hypothetical protein
MAVGERDVQDLDNVASRGTNRSGAASGWEVDESLAKAWGKGDGTNEGIRGKLG